MKRFTLSTFSVLAVAGALSLGEGLVNAPSAQAMPKAEFNLQTLRLSEFDARNKSDAEFKLQTLRLSEFDARNKSGDYSQSSYSQSDYSESSYPQPADALPAAQTVSTEEDSAQTAEPTAWEAPKPEKETESSGLSVTQRRHQFLDSRS